jgi:hypothetical protein
MGSRRSTEGAHDSGGVEVYCRGSAGAPAVIILALTVDVGCP